MKELSVFLPAYNEEANIKKTVFNVLSVLKKISQRYELIIVNDGSTDKTGIIIKELAKANKNIKLINHPKNKGYGAALKTGMRAARYKWVCYMDSDGQFDFADISKLLSSRNQADMIIGYRQKRKDSIFRRILAKILWLADLILFGVNFKDIDCGFKLFKKEIVDKVWPLKTESAITETEFVVRSKRAGFNIHQVPVVHNIRYKGIQTGAKIRVVSQAAKEGISLYFSFLKERLSSRPFLALLLILGLAAFLRLYKISDYLTFLGDEGRDVLVVKRMIIDHKFTLLGPTASVGGFFLGPIYYYFMLPFLWLFRFDPVGPAIMVALAGTATVYLIYKFCLTFFNENVGLLAAFVYSISSLIIVFSRSSWNPNVLPFFSLVLAYSLARAILRGESFYFWIVGLSLGVALQLHYMAVLLIPIIIVSYLLLNKKKQILKDLLIITIGFIITFSPFLLFELRHNFPNTISLYNFILKGKEVGLFVKHETGEAVSNNFFALIFQLFRQTISYNNYSIGKIVLALSLLGVMAELLKPKIATRKTLFFILILISSTLLGNYYKRPIYDYYLAYLFPYPVIIFSLSLNRIVGKHKGILALGAILVFLITYNNLKTNILNKPANNQVEQTKKVTQLVTDQAQTKPFNFALITEGNSDHAYRYFLEINGFKPKTLEEEVTEQLLVVCEQRECQPLGHPLWEVAGFGRAEIDGHWQGPAGIEIYRLVHHQESMKFIGKPAPKGG